MHYLHRFVNVAACPSSYPHWVCWLGCSLTTLTLKWYASWLAIALRWRQHLKFVACYQRLLSSSYFMNPTHVAYLPLIIPTSLGNALRKLIRLT